MNKSHRKRVAASCVPQALTLLMRRAQQGCEEEEAMHTTTTSLRQALPLRLGLTRLPAAHAKSVFSVSLWNSSKVKWVPVCERRCGLPQAHLAGLMALVVRAARLFICAGKGFHSEALEDMLPTLAPSRPAPRR